MSVFPSQVCCGLRVKSIALETGRCRFESQSLPVACVTRVMLLSHLTLVSKFGKLVGDI